MEINKVIEDKCATVALSGRLDTLTSPQRGGKEAI